MAGIPLRVVQYGLGPIGQASARTVLAKQASGHVVLVGAIDVDPAKVGQDVGALLKLGRDTGVVISDDAEGTLRATRPDVVLHTTTSFLEHMYGQLVTCAQAGAHVVSTTEELAFPYDRHPDIARELDAVAKEHGVAILGTGVNPGYAMDTLALMATGVCADVRGIAVRRVVDAGLRREPLQRKVGAGLTVEAFEEKKATGTFGHIGLRESLLMVGSGLGWSFDRIVETLDPVVSDKDVQTPFLDVAVGDVAGIHHRIEGYRHDAPIVVLDLKMYVGADAPIDAVDVDGDPPIRMHALGGIFGDTATVAILVNMAPLVMDVPAGLKTMKDVPVPRAFATPLRPSP